LSSVVLCIFRIDKRLFASDFASSEIGFAHASHRIFTRLDGFQRNIAEKAESSMAT